MKFFPLVLSLLFFCASQAQAQGIDTALWEDVVQELREAHSKYAEDDAPISPETIRNSVVAVTGFASIGMASYWTNVAENASLQNLKAFPEFAEDVRLVEKYKKKLKELKTQAGVSGSRALKYHITSDGIDDYHAISISRAEQDLDHARSHLKKKVATVFNEKPLLSKPQFKNRAKFLTANKWFSYATALYCGATLIHAVYCSGSEEPSEPVVAEVAVIFISLDQPNEAFIAENSPESSKEDLIEDSTGDEEMGPPHEETNKEKD